MPTTRNCSGTPTALIRLRMVCARVAELLIYGDIGDTFASESVTAAAVVQQLGELPPDLPELRVRINSCGGSVADGLAIYNALRGHTARKIVTIDGVAASIASTIAMAGDEVRMPPASLLMIHAPWTVSAGGNAAELRGFATQLDAWAAAMEAAYVAKSGLPTEEVRAMLTDGADHWFTADQALAAGFADAIEKAGYGGDGEGAGSEAAPAAANDDAADPSALPAAAALRSGLLNLVPRAPALVAGRLRSLALGDTPMPAPAASPSAATAADAVAAERHRYSQIRMMADRHASNAAVASLADRCMRDGTSFEAFGAAALQVLGAGVESIGGAIRTDPTGHGDFVAAAADALVARAGIRIDRPHAGARDFMAMDAGELARACLARCGRSTRELDRVGAIRAALSTSDFAAILGTALGKSLRQGYEAEPQSHALWARFVMVEDFKPQLRAILSSAPDLLHVPEGGEYEHGALDDDAATYAVAKYGRIIRLTWEALINDDLGAFVRLPQAMGQAARRKEADLVYSLFAANGGAGPIMQDGVALFAAAHANVGAQVLKLDAQALSSARTLLRKQTAKGGGVLNLQPRSLIVPVELETDAETLLATSARAVAAGSDASVLPGWIGGLQLVVEPRLSGSAFYLAASADQVDTLEVAGLQADDGLPVVEEESEFHRDAKAWKVRHVVATAFTDWRGIVKVPVGA